MSMVFLRINSQKKSLSVNCSNLVVNASPIISLAKIGCADLLIRMFPDLVIPLGVFEEITAHSIKDEAVKWITAQNPDHVKPVDVPEIIAGWNLGKGESQVIAYAYKNGGHAVSIDDRPARKCAHLFGIKVKGTLALLIDAKRNGFIPLVQPCLIGLKADGFRMSEEIYRSALHMAGE
jgi:predicted nucleic acid-binding protein